MVQTYQVASSVSFLLGRIGGWILLHLVYPFKAEKNVAKLCSKAETLQAKSNDIKQQIENAERRQQVATHEVENWLEMVEGIMREVNGIRNAYTKRKLCFGRFSPNIFSSYRISRRASKKLKKLDELFDRGKFEDTVVDTPPPPVQQMHASARVVIGMKTYMDNVMCYLRDESIPIIGLWGMGGVGKTTLLKMINTQFLESVGNLQFDLVICIAASKGCSIESLQKSLLEKMRLQLGEYTKSESCQHSIFSYLRRRNFLLLLDDLWEEVSLEQVGVPLRGDNRHKVILATRSKEVCSMMGAGATIKITCLGPDDAWKLFKQNVTEETISSDIRIELLANEVCKRCSGLPLALVSVGKSMSIKSHWQEWEAAVISLERNYQLLEGSLGMKDFNSILWALRLTYDNLDNDIIKKCFLVSSLWPEDYSIWNIDLVNCWIGLGLIPIQGAISKSHSMGYSVIESLKRVCLFEEGDMRYTEIRVHSIVRDMALWIASDNETKRNGWLMQAGQRLNVVAKEDIERWAGATRISVMCNFIISLPSELPRCPDLSVLVLQQNFHFNKLPINFFSVMPSLKYLDLSWTQVDSLSDEIGSLVNLQYLNLADSNIVSLPKGLMGLKHLRFLNLNFTNHLTEIPARVISQLPMLKILFLYQSKYSGFEKEFYENHNIEETEEFCLDELKCFDKGLALCITVRTTKALSKLSSLLNIYVHNLGVEELNGVSSVGLKLQSSITVVNFRMCLSVQELSIEYDGDSCSDKSIPHLEYLTFLRLPKLHKVSLDKELIYIRMLSIIKNDCLTDITWILKLPHLEHLDLSFCSSLENVIVDTNNGLDGDIIEAKCKVHTFSKLRILQLNHLTSLRRFSHLKLSCTSLEYMDVFDCPLLDEFPLQPTPDGTTHLKQIRGEEQWWHNLKWESDSQARYTQFYKVFDNNFENFEPTLGTNPFIQSKSSFFTRRRPMMRTTIQFPSKFSLGFDSTGETTETESNDSQASSPK